MAAARKRTTTRPPAPDDEADIERRRDQVVEMYKAGYKMAEIAAETGFPQGTLFWVLRKRGIKPDRYGRGEEDEGVSSSDLLTELRSALRENGQLRDRVERQQAIIDALMERLEGKNGQPRPQPRAPTRPARTSTKGS